jgi:hypothetical protein
LPIDRWIDFCQLFNTRNLATGAVMSTVPLPVLHPVDLAQLRAAGQVN